MSLDVARIDCGQVRVELEDYILANAPEYVVSMAAADEAIERGEPGVPLGEVIAEFEAEHGPLDSDEG